jgi:NADPH-dependent 2,4-dienoyl-CoA reductase/sulfur reductase-like enzyme/rhodanese-related sulfurtransferase
MSNRRIVVVGGVAAGLKAASRARRRDGDAEITVVDQGDFISYIACGLPYWISGDIRDGRNLWPRDPEHFWKRKRIAVLTRTRAEAIDRATKTLRIRDLASDDVRDLPYDKLVLATGGRAFVPPVPGRDLEGAFALESPRDAMAIRRALDEGNRKDAVVVGGGFIGMEMAEALWARGRKVTIVEMMDRLLPGLLDSDISEQVCRHVREKGVKVILGQALTGLEGDEAGHVCRARVGEESLDADLVVFGVGVRPNVELAEEAGLEIGSTGAIAVDDRLRTSDPDIYAGGDCAENVHLVTGKPVYVPLGSTANKHGRVIGTNVTGGDEIFPGILGTGIVKVFDFNVGKTGLTEAQARENGLETVTASVSGDDAAGFYPGARQFMLKLVAEAMTGRLLGAQAAGPGDVSKRVDVAATALSWGASVRELSSLDLAYAPPYSHAMDAVITAANVVQNKLDEVCRGQCAARVCQMQDEGTDFILLDVRSEEEYAEERIADPRVRHLTLDELRERAGELPKETPIVAVCRQGTRAYEAARALESMGFRDVCIMEGGLEFWPGELCRDVEAGSRSAPGS